MNPRPGRTGWHTSEVSTKPGLTTSGQDVPKELAHPQNTPDEGDRMLADPKRVPFHKKGTPTR